MSGLVGYILMGEKGEKGSPCGQSWSVELVTYKIVYTCFSSRIHTAPLTSITSNRYQFSQTERNETRSDFLCYLFYFSNICFCQPYNRPSQTSVYTCFKAVFTFVCEAIAYKIVQRLYIFFLTLKTFYGTLRIILFYFIIVGIICIGISNKNK